MSITTFMPKEKIKSLSEDDLKEVFATIGRQVTKKDKYQACIDLGRGGVPVDIRTVEDYMKGTVRDVDFGNELFQYLTACGYNTAA